MHAPETWGIQSKNRLFSRLDTLHLSKPSRVKKIVGLIGIIVWTQPGFSQQHFGMKAGFNMAWRRQHYASSVYPSGWKPDIKALAGYEAGFFYHIPLAEHWLLSAEANFTLRGAKTQAATYVDGRLFPEGSKEYYTDKLFYLDIPLLVQYKVHRFTAGAGPSAGLLTKSRTIFRDSNFPSGFRTFDAGINLLAGCQLARKWEVDLRYYHGLTNTYPVDVVTAHNRFANVSLLYTLK